MPLGYDPSARTLSVTYYVDKTNQRWFIPFNTDDTTAKQLSQCNKLVGKDASDEDVGSETVA